MPESILEALRRISKNDSDTPDSVDQPHEKNPEISFLAALPVVRKIVRHRLVSSRQVDARDLEQGIFLRLLRWREKYRERSEKMSPDDWESFAARTAYNETNRHFSKSADASNLPLSAASLVSAEKSVTGESKTEVQSLALVIWQEICQMTLRQRRALLLHSQYLIVYFQKGGITDEILAQSLGLTESEWLEVKTRLPLSDASIAHFYRRTDKASSIETIIKSIKKARYEARTRLRKLTNK